MNRRRFFAALFGNFLVLGCHGLTTTPVSEERPFPASEEVKAASYSNRDPISELPEANRVVAEVAGEPVTAADVFPLLYLSAHDATIEAVRQVVIQRLVRIEAHRLGVTTPMEKTEAEASRLLKEFEENVMSATQGSQDLATYVSQTFGMSLAEYGSWLQESVMNSLLLERLILYELHQHDRAQVRLIRVSTLEEAEDILSKVRRGADFSTIARERSEDAQATEGGLYPPLPTDFDYPLFEHLASLEPGEYDEVREVETAEGLRYRVLQLVNRLSADQSSYDALRLDLEAELERRVLSPLELETWMRIMEDRHQVLLLGIGKADG